MSILKNIGYDFVGIFGSAVLIIGIILLSLYSFILQIIIRPMDVADKLLALCTKFQDWVEKKEDKK